MSDDMEIDELEQQLAMIIDQNGKKRDALIKEHDQLIKNAPKKQKTEAKKNKRLAVAGLKAEHNAAIGPLQKKLKAAKKKTAKQKKDAPVVGQGAASEEGVDTRGHDHVRHIDVEVPVMSADKPVTENLSDEDLDRLMRFVDAYEQEFGLADMDIDAPPAAEASEPAYEEQPEQMDTSEPMEGVERQQPRQGKAGERKGLKGLTAEKQRSRAILKREARFKRDRQTKFDTERYNNWMAAVKQAEDLQRQQKELKDLEDMGKFIRHNEELMNHNIQLFREGGKYDQVMQQIQDTHRNDPDGAKDAFAGVSVSLMKIFSDMEHYRQQLEAVHKSGKLENPQEKVDVEAALNAVTVAMQRFHTRHHILHDSLLKAPSTEELKTQQEREGKPQFEKARLDVPALPDEDDPELAQDVPDLPEPGSVSKVLEKHTKENSAPRNVYTGAYIPKRFTEVDALIGSLKKMRIGRVTGQNVEPDVEGLIGKMGEMDASLQESPASEGFASTVAEPNVALQQQQSTSLDVREVEEVMRMSLAKVKKQVKSLHATYDLLIPELASPENKTRQKEALRSVKTARKYLLDVLRAVKSFTQPKQQQQQAPATSARMEAILGRLADVLEGLVPKNAAPEEPKPPQQQQQPQPPAGQTGAPTDGLPTAPTDTAPPAGLGGMSLTEEEIPRTRQEFDDTVDMGGGVQAGDVSEMGEGLREAKQAFDAVKHWFGGARRTTDQHKLHGRRLSEGVPDVSEHGVYSGRPRNRFSYRKRDGFGGRLALTMGGGQDARPAAVDVRGRLTYANSGMAAYQQKPIPVHQVPFIKPPGVGRVKDPRQLPNVPAPALTATNTNAHAPPVLRIRT